MRAGSQNTQSQEDANLAACRAVFVKAHPKENPDASELCDNGSWACKKCPWRPSKPKTHPLVKAIKWEPKNG